MNEQQLTTLLNQMTLEEKIAQLQRLAANFYEGQRMEDKSLALWHPWELRTT